MAFKLYYNDLFPLRMINFVKKYLEINGVILVDNRVAAQLSKLQVLEYFFPGLFVKESFKDDAEYDYEKCYIHAPKKQGVLSNYGPYKQKINALEDCLLGNSRNEKSYKNYSSAQNMLRRAAMEMSTDESLYRSIVSNLRKIHDESLNDEQKYEINVWMSQLIEKCRDDDIYYFCTMKRTDGFSFERNVYDSLLDVIQEFDQNGNSSECWVWLCLGALFGNYISLLLKKYQMTNRVSSLRRQETESYRLISSPAVFAKPGFCGRDRYLERIDDLFESGNRVIFLYGIGGIGKTEIARQYAAMHQNEYDVIVFAVYDRSLKDLMISEMPFEIRPALSRLSKDGVRETDDEYYKRKLDIIRKSSDRRTLIIIDNFNTDYDENLRQFINGRYRILFTTQYDYSREYASIHVKEIEDKEALLDIFMNHYQGYAVERDDPDLYRLIRSVKSHTYTVTLLAHHMENSGETPSEILQSLSKKGISSLNEMVSMNEGETDEAYMNLIRMFGIFDFNEEEQKVLKYLSLISSGSVPAMVFKKWADLPNTRNILSLEKRGWIIRNHDGITLHPVVCKVLEYLRSFDLTDINPFLEKISDSLANENSWHFTKAEKEQYCIIAGNIMKQLGEVNDENIRFAQTYTVLLGYSGYPKEAIRFGKQLFDYRNEHDGYYAFETGRAAYRIGWTSLFNPQLEESSHALEWLLKAEDIFEHIQIETIDQKAMFCGLLENISKAYSTRYEKSREQNDIDLALQYAEKAVSKGRSWLNDYRQTKKSPAGSLLRLADVKMQMNEYEEAEKLIDEAYEILTSIYQPHDPDVLRASSRKATVLYYLERYRESLAMTQENLEAYSTYHGDVNPSLFDQLVLKIRNCIALNRKEEALDTRKEALKIGKKIYTPDSERLQLLNEILIES